MSALAVGGLVTTLCVRRVGGWRGLLLRTLLAYGFGSFAFVGGVATISGYGASRAGRWVGPLIQGVLATSVGTGRLYSSGIDIPVLIE